MKNMMLLFGLAVIAIVIVVIATTIDKTAKSQLAIEQQRVQLGLAQEQTKQEAQQLRADATARTTNGLTLILGAILAFGCIGVVLVFINDRISKNRIHEMQALAREERLQIRELKQLEILHQKQLAASTQWYLTGNTNYGENKERQIMIYENDDAINYK